MSRVPGVSNLRPIGCALVAVLAASLLASSARALPHSWVNPAGGSSTTPGNWSPASFPAPTDPATFSLANTYSTSFLAPADTLDALTVSAGVVTFNTSDRLGIRQVAHVTGANLTLTHPQLASALYRAGQWVVGTGSAGLSTLTIAGDATTVVSTDSAASSFLGNTTNASVSIFDGSSFRSNGGYEIGTQAASTCSTTVAGFSLLQLRGAELRTLARPNPTNGWPDRGRIIVGAFGHGGLGVANGAFVGVATDLTLAKFPNSIGQVRLFKTTTRNPNLNVARHLYLGSTFGVTSGGTAALSVEAGTLRVGGQIVFGNFNDPLNTPVHARLLVHDGGNVIAGGLNFDSNESVGRLELRGGTVQIVPGEFANVSGYHQKAPFSISSGVGSPKLWIEPGTYFSINGATPLFGIGRGGNGTVRVVGSAHFTCDPNVVLADSSGGNGTFEVDSSAHVTLTRIKMAENGTATLSVRGGSSLALKRLTVGSGQPSNGTANVLVSGPQSLLSVDDTCEVYTVSTVPLTVTADSAAFLYTYGSYPLFLLGKPTKLVVAHGASVIAEGGIQLWMSELAMDGGNVRTGSSRLDVINDATVHGTGVIRGPTRLISLASRLSVTPSDPAHGELRVGDPTLANGFESYGRTYVADDRLIVEDSDGARLADVSIAGGTLVLPQGGEFFSGDTLYGYGLVDGSVFLLSGAIQIDLNSEMRFTRELRAYGGPISGGTLHILEGGTLDRSQYTITSNLLLDGTIVFDGLAGLLDIDADMTLGPLSTTPIRLQQHVPPVLDRVQVAGALTLGGTLALRCENEDYVPAVGDTFTVMTAGFVIGTFNHVTLNGAPANGLVNVIYSLNSVKVAIIGNGGPLTGVDPGAPIVDASLPLRFAALGSPRAPGLALDLPTRGHARVTLYDVTGREVAVVTDGELEAGPHRFSLSASTPSSGVYFARATLALATERRVLTARIVRLR